MSERSYGKDFAGSAPQNYERYFVPSIGAPVANDLIATAELQAGERVLDVACGTGVAARLASRAVGNEGAVAGLDVNPGMLAVASSVTPPHMEIDWREGNAESMPFPDESFEVVLCQMGLQFMADKLAALKEMCRVLTPGGRLILNLPGPAPRPFEIMAEGFARHISAEAAKFVYLVFSLHDSTKLETLISGAGFSDVSCSSQIRSLQLPSPAEFLWQYIHSTPLSGAAAQVEEDKRAALERDIVAKWQDFVEDQSLMLDVRMLEGMGRK